MSLYESMKAARDALHRDCSPEDHTFHACPCICGCETDAGCPNIFGPLCAVCVIRVGRGDEEHGEQESKS